MIVFVLRDVTISSLLCRMLLPVDWIFPMSTGLSRYMLHWCGRYNQSGHNKITVICNRCCCCYNNITTTTAVTLELQFPEAHSNFHFSTIPLLVLLIMYIVSDEQQELVCQEKLSSFFCQRRYVVSWFINV